MLLALTLFAAACTNTAGGDSYDSVRDRMSDGPTQLLVGSAGSTGSITARRWTPSGWVEGVTPVAIESGGLSAKVDSHGALKVDYFEVNLAPIDIPEEVFHKPSQLVDVRVSLTKPVSADMAWTSDDDATATLTLDLDFNWAFAINGNTTQLATQHLPPIMIDLVVTGGGDHIDASVSMQANGELWNWADLLKMTKLDLSLSAATAD